MKDLKDYLHLYLGCECVAKYPYNGEKERRMTIIAPNLHELLDEVEYCKPILRPLSDITEKEQDEIWYSEEPMGVAELNAGTIRRKVVLCPNRIKYLLSKGFDLFGLIQSGLAIDATKLKKS